MSARLRRRGRRRAARRSRTVGRQGRHDIDGQVEQLSIGDEPEPRPRRGPAVPPAARPPRPPRPHGRLPGRARTRPAPHWTCRPAGPAAARTAQPASSGRRAREGAAAPPRTSAAEAACAGRPGRSPPMAAVTDRPVRVDAGGGPVDAVPFQEREHPHRHHRLGGAVEAADLLQLDRREPALADDPPAAMSVRRQPERRTSSSSAAIVGLRLEYHVLGRPHGAGAVDHQLPVPSGRR